MLHGLFWVCVIFFVLFFCDGEFCFYSWLSVSCGGGFLISSLCWFLGNKVLFSSRASMLNKNTKTCLMWRSHQASVLLSSSLSAGGGTRSSFVAEGQTTGWLLWASSQFSKTLQLVFILSVTGLQHCQSCWTSSMFSFILLISTQLCAFSCFLQTSSISALLSWTFSTAGTFRLLWDGLNFTRTNFSAVFGG